MIALVDLSISGSNFNGTSLPLAQGLEQCRTTRLHWLQTGLTQRANGSFAASTMAIAEYGMSTSLSTSFSFRSHTLAVQLTISLGGPMPPLNDIPHTYTFYLFHQPSNFTLPAYDAGRNLTAAPAEDRMNFSATAIASVAGAPILANYIRVQNPGNNATGSYSNGTCPTNFVVVGGNGNASVTGTGSAPSATYTGGVEKIGFATDLVMAVGGAVAFALL